MLQILSKEITSFFIAHHILKNEYRELCEYSLQKRLSTYSLILLLIAICSFKCTVIEISFFLFCVLSLRKRTGGYHAQTPWKCSVVTIGTTIFSMYLLFPIAQKMSVLFLNAIYCVCICAVLLFAPVNHPNMNMTKEELLATKQKMCEILIALSFVLMLLQQFNERKLCSLLVLALFNVTLSVLFGKLIGQEVNAV